MRHRLCLPRRPRSGEDAQAPLEAAAPHEHQPAGVAERPASSRAPYADEDEVDALDDADDEPSGCAGFAQCGATNPC